MAATLFDCWLTLLTYDPTVSSGKVGCIRSQLFNILQLISTSLSTLHPLRMRHHKCFVFPRTLLWCTCHRIQLWPAWHKMLHGCFLVYPALWWNSATVSLLSLRDAVQWLSSESSYPSGNSMLKFVSSAFFLIFLCFNTTLNLRFLALSILLFSCLVSEQEFGLCPNWSRWTFSPTITRKVTHLTAIFTV